MSPTSAASKAASPESVSIRSAWEMEWTPIGRSPDQLAQDRIVPGPAMKVLKPYQPGGSKTYIMHLPPGWYDPVLDWHPSAEESFKLAGASQLADNRLEKWCYLYRPPGILHGPAQAPTDEGATSLMRMSGEHRILRYDGAEFPHRHLQPITDDYKNSPVEMNEHFDLNKPPWEPVETGGWKGASVKWAHRNKVTAGGAVLLQIPPGWSGRGSLALGPIEEFVVEGSISAGAETYGKWGYAYRPQGAAAGEYSSEEGAVLFCWWDGGDELAAGRSGD